MAVPVTVAETSEYIRCADRLLSAAERMEVVVLLAANPRAGDLIQGTGGVRKLRWRRGARGKSGGVRVIYYFHSEVIPLYLLAVFGKHVRADLSKAERNDLARLVSLLKQAAENER
jgi:mRNA-degrading endonuclease RelE of RelBE toxin-antitoxin system